MEALLNRDVIEVDGPRRNGIHVVPICKSVMAEIVAGRSQKHRQRLDLGEL